MPLDDGQLDAASDFESTPAASQAHNLYSEEIGSIGVIDTSRLIIE